MTDRPHARLAPSGAHRWVPCAGSVAMQERMPPDDETPEAREGTAAHWAALDMMGKIVSIGTLAPNGHPIDAAMLEGAAMLDEDVLATIGAASPSASFHVERHIAAHSTIHPDNDGTPDAYLIDRERKVVHGWDYKYGHKYVSVYENWQLVNYLAAILETHGVTRYGLPEWKATFTIVQPRCYHSDGPVREWHTDGKRLQMLFDQLRDAAHAASRPDAPCRSGPQCHKCRAAFDCEAHLQSGQTAVDMVGTQVPLDMSPAALALWKRTVHQAAARLKSISDATDERILGLIRSGQQVPGWGIGMTAAHERWRDPSAAMAMGDMFGVDLRKPDELVTPKQAAKMGIDRAVISEYSEIPTGAQKLVKRDGDAALSVFGSR